MFQYYGEYFILGDGVHYYENAKKVGKGFSILSQIIKLSLTYLDHMLDFKLQTSKAMASNPYRKDKSHIKSNLFLVYRFLEDHKIEPLYQLVHSYISFYCKG